MIIAADLGLYPGNGSRKHEPEVRLRLALPEQFWSHYRAWLEVSKELVPWIAWNMPQRMNQILCVPVLNQPLRLLIIVRWVGDVALLNMAVLVENKVAINLNVLVVDEATVPARVGFGCLVKQKSGEKLLH